MVTFNCEYSRITITLSTPFFPTTEYRIFITTRAFDFSNSFILVGLIQNSQPSLVRKTIKKRTCFKQETLRDFSKKKRLINALIY